MGKERIAIIGSGNWSVSSLVCEERKLMIRGSAIARIAGQNAKKHSDLFEEEVKIWVFEEDVRLVHTCVRTRG